MAMSVRYSVVNGILMGESRNGVETEYVHDTQGNIIQCKDAAGNITYSAEYWPYGEVRTESGTNPSNWKYGGGNGYYTDSTSSLYIRTRYYRPIQGRWQSVDSLWPRESAYGYADGDPVTKIDRDGTQVSCSGLIRDLCASGGPISFISACEDCLKDLKQYYLDTYPDEPSGKNNALRHCIGTCDAARNCGDICSGLIVCNEFGIHNWNSKDSQNDRWNNSIGHGFATKKGTCFSQCNDAWRRGLLR